MWYLPKKIGNVPWLHFLKDFTMELNPKNVCTHVNECVYTVKPVSKFNSDILS